MCKMLEHRDIRFKQTDVGTEFKHKYVWLVICVNGYSI